MSDEDAGLFQEQLRKRFRNEDNRQRVEMVEIVENLERDTKKLAQEEESLQSQLLREHKQFLRDENESLAKMKDGRKDSQATVRPASTLPTVNLYDISSHRPVSALEFQYVNIWHFTRPPPQRPEVAGKGMGGRDSGDERSQAGTAWKMNFERPLLYNLYKIASYNSANWL